MHGWGQSLPLLWGEGVLSSDGRGTERETDRQTETDRETERDGDRDRDRDREMGAGQRDGG